MRKCLPLQRRGRLETNQPREMRKSSCSLELLIDNLVTTFDLLLNLGLIQFLQNH